MYDRDWHQKAIALVKNEDSNPKTTDDCHRTVVKVEMALRLLEVLGLESESVLSVWIVLSGLPIPYAGLRDLKPAQRRAQANARTLLDDYSGLTGWEWDLRKYTDVDPKLRCYELAKGNFEKQTVKRIDGRFPERITEYDKQLTKQLRIRNRSIKPAVAGPVRFRVRLQEEEHTVTIDIPEKLISKANVPLPWFTQPRPRAPIKVSYPDILEEAMFVDGREKERQIKQEKPRDWAKFIEERFRYVKVIRDGTGWVLGKANADAIEIDGMTHLAGMVASGKSTLMDLLAVYLFRHTDCRITLVVSDTATVLARTNYFNNLLAEEGGPPVAVPLLGRTQRDKHLVKVYDSEDYEADGWHWGLRSLNIACPLQGLATVSQLPAPLPPGKEPCERLEQDYRTADGRIIKSRRVACPLFAACPAQQTYRDMPGARIWITTPGGLGQAGIPSQADKRDIRLDEIVYEQSDVVVFDEIDLCQAWFDNLCAPEVTLSDSRGGFLDDIDVQIAQGWIPRRVQPPDGRRWLQAERNSVNVISHMLSFFYEHEDIEVGLGRGYFTAYKRFLSLAHRFAQMLGEEPSGDDAEAQWEAGTFQNGPTVEKAMRYFRDLLEKDPMNVERPVPGNGYDEKLAIYRLSQIIIHIVAQADILADTTVQECVLWIMDFIEPKPSQPQETVRTFNASEMSYLADQLELALTVAALDHNMHIVLSEWQRRPLAVTGDLDDSQRYSRAPADLATLLPVPPTGSLFGFYYRREGATRRRLAAYGEQTAEEARRLSVFEYANLGRCYLLNYHQLRTDLDGVRGPNVLALSGTSWLPDSSRLHFYAEPKGILQPEKESEEAIARSEFFFAPQMDRGKDGPVPISVSGERDMDAQLKKLAARLASSDRNARWTLRTELERLEKLGQTKPEWSNRKRILVFVNSYDQATAAAIEIAGRLYGPNEQDRVVCVRRTVTEDGEAAWAPYQQINAGDVPGFAATNGEILIAPIQAISRGYNVLAQTIDRRNVAAIGSVFFLTRPMPIPFDATETTRELNRDVLRWCLDPAFDVLSPYGSLYEKGKALRELTRKEQQKIESRHGYRSLGRDPRRDLAASTAGVIIQACGRLLRGGVPFRAFFVDAKWAPKSAERLAGRATKGDTPTGSLLAEMIEVLSEYVQDPVGRALYGPLVNALCKMTSTGNLFLAGTKEA
jgi:hypothetical protein